MTRKNEPAFSLTKDDFVFQTFRSGGKGGQNQNKRDTGVRIIHPASGARAESREERSQWQNKRNALKKLVKDPIFLWWIEQKLRGIETTEKWLEKQLAPENLKVEYIEDGEWVEVD